MQIAYIEGPLWVVRDDDDEIIGVFGAKAEDAAERCARERRAYFTEDEGVFVCVKDDRGRPHGWYGPFDHEADARLYVAEQLQLDPVEGHPIDVMGDAVDEDPTDELFEDLGFDDAG